MNNLAKKIFAVGLAASTAAMGLAPMAAFAAAHSAGTNVVGSDGTVYMITTDNMRRPYTSAGAFLSYGFNSFASTVEANADDMALPVGSFIPPQDGKVICADRDDSYAVAGTCYIISNGQRLAFTSESVFTGRGFSFSRAENADVSWMTVGPWINDTTSPNPVGVLVNNGGTVQLRGDGVNLGIPDLATFNSWGYSFADVVPANSADSALTQSGVMVARQPGQLSPSFTTGGGTTPPPAGSVTVSAASTQTPASTIPQQATNVNVVKFNVYNGSSQAATINQVTVHRDGAGQTTDISSAYLYQGSSRLTSGRSINSSTNEAVFSGLNVTVPAYGTVTLDVLVDIANQGTGNVHQFSISSVMLGSTQASGTAMGNLLTIAGVDAGSVTITKSGTITNPTVGSQGVKVAQFQLQAGTTEDVTIKRISLYFGGAVTSSYLTNFMLKQAGNTVATASSLDSKDKANFDLNFSLAKGDTRTFEVYADIGAGARTGSAETVTFYLEEGSDLYAVGNTFGFGVSVDNSSSGTYDGATCTSASGNCSYSYVEGGQLTISFNGPASKDIAKNDKDVEVFNFTMTAQNNLEVRQLGLDFGGGTGTANFENSSNVQLYTDVKIVDTATNQVVWGPLDFNDSSDTTEEIIFTEDITLTAGQSRTFKVTLDVSNDDEVVDGDDIAVTLDISDLTSNDVRNLDNNTYLTSADIVPTGDITGNTMTIATAGLTVTLSSTPTSQSYVKGTSNVDAVGFAFTASTAKDVKVTDITLEPLIGTTTGATALLADATSAKNVSDNVVTVELYHGATKIGQTKSPATSTGLITFSGLNWVIPAGTTQILTVKMSLSASAETDIRVKWSIENGDVVAVDNDGNTVSVTDSNINDSQSTTAGTVTTISGAGSISVASAGQSQSDGTDARIVNAGQTGVTLGKINFTAQSEALKLTKLRINVLSASPAGSASVADDITALYLYDGSTLVGTGILVASSTSEGYADFTSVSPDFVINKDATKALTVKADLNTISGGADSGDEFAVNLSSTNFEARGVSGSTIKTTFTGAYTGAYMVLRKSQPVIEVLDAGSALSNGTVTVFRFKVTAQNGDVALKHFTFTTSTTTGVNLSSFAISEQGGSSITVTEAESYAAGLTTWNVSFDTQEIILGGTSKTYDVKATVGGATEGDSIATSIAATDSDVVTGYLTSLAAAMTVTDQDDDNDAGNDQNAGAVTANLIWSDMSAVPHNDTVGSSGAEDWTNGRHVRTLPTDAEGLSL